MTAPPPLATDALIIGAGPGALFLVFELGLQGLRAQVLDVLPQAGGQARQLYADTPIYDIPGLPRCTGRELTERLLAQAAPFAPAFHFDQLVSDLAWDEGQARWRVGTHRGLRFAARAVFIATGVGAFLPRLPKVEGLEALLGTQVLAETPPAPALGGQRVVVLGDGDEALDGATALALRDADRPASVTLAHRRDAFSASADAVARMRAACAQGRLRFAIGQITGWSADAAARLAALELTPPDDPAEWLPADALLVRQGRSPRLGPLTNWGLTMQRKQLGVDTATFACGAPGLYAIGDAIGYPGKRKLILSAFHEAALAAFGAAEYLAGQKLPLEYSTSSARLHRLLGVEHPG